jgi:hypothetical protein
MFGPSLNGRDHMQGCRSGNDVEFYNIDSIKAVVDLKKFSKGETKVLPSLEGLPPFYKSY